MAVLGPADQKNLVLPNLWDNTYINNVRLESGKAFEDMLREIRQGLQMFNVSNLLGMTNYGSMVAVQDTPEVEYASGSSGGVQEFTEYKPADPYRGITTGHMIGLKTWNRTLGWTMLYLMKARESQLDADLRSAFLDINVQWQQRALQRFFKSTADTLGSTGKSVPLADGGTADTTYIPYTSPRGDTMYWIGSAGPAKDDSDGTDFHATFEGHCSVTPLQVDLTEHDSLATWGQRLNGRLA